MALQTFAARTFRAHTFAPGAWSGAAPPAAHAFVAGRPADWRGVDTGRRWRGVDTGRRWHAGDTGRRWRGGP